MRRLLALIAITFTVAACGAGVTAPPAHVAIPATHVAVPAAHVSDTSAAKLGIKHVFLIVLENESYTDSYLHNPNHYLGKTLQGQGTLLTQFYGVGHNSLDNYIAMVSGQAPNKTTSADCQQYVDLNGTTHVARLNSSGQAYGAGCVYPKNVKTLANQLTNHHVSWHGYMEDMGNDPSREQKRCGVPHLVAGLDQTQRATPTDQYAARHNPFVYFHSLIDSGLCRQHVGPLTALPTALRSAKTTPRFSFITPNLCDDGHDTNCMGKDAKGSSAGGLTSIDHFLSTWVPRIKASPAYKDGGLIIITSDESETTDASSCCNERPGPNDPTPGKTGPGGGRIGTLVIGKCVAHGARDAKPYNHYSLLRSLEDVFGIVHGGTDGHGHLGFAAAHGLRPFGHDLYSRCKAKK